MTDDIVTRLRENCDTSDCVNVRSIALVKCNNCEAADEIEYLRNEIAEMHSEYQKLWNKHNEVMRDKVYPLSNNYTVFEYKR